MIRKIKQTFPSLYEFYMNIIAYRNSKLSLKGKKKLLEKMYSKLVGGTINWEHPIKYSEKMQWKKLYSIDPIETLLSDKFAVREWIKNKIGEEYLIPLYGVWDKFDDIDFDTLPNQFVLKTNHGSATNYIVKNKSLLNIKQARKDFNKWLKTDYGWKSLELQYSKIERKIIAEELLQFKGGIEDYKFLCFNGEIYYIWIDTDRFSNHKRNIYDLDWNIQPWNQKDYGNIEFDVPKPKNFDKMIEIVQTLCSGFSHVRVDLYNIDGRIYFGEMTFTNGSGFEKIIPDQYDIELGQLWNLPKVF